MTTSFWVQRCKAGSPASLTQRQAGEAGRSGTGMAAARPRLGAGRLRRRRGRREQPAPTPGRRAGRSLPTPQGKAPPPSRPTHASLSPAPMSHNLSSRLLCADTALLPPRPAAATRALGHGPPSPHIGGGGGDGGEKRLPGPAAEKPQPHAGEETNLKAEAPARLPPPRRGAHSRQAAGVGSADSASLSKWRHLPLPLHPRRPQLLWGL